MLEESQGELQLPTTCKALSPEALKAIREMQTSDADARGAVFTKPEVVCFILDLVGYTSDKNLAHLSILEPSFGRGDFLFQIIERLIYSWKKSPRRLASDLNNAIRAVELHAESASKTKQWVINKLTAEGIRMQDAKRLADKWLITGDYLLTEFDCRFDFVAGNPPYVRQEMIPHVLLTEYKKRYKTIYDRADLYVPFFEKSLLSLKPSGVHGFICADRWMKNKYGGPLRRLVSEKFSLKTYVDMTGTDAFSAEVIAYPAITIITTGKQGATDVARRPEVSQTNLNELACKLRKGAASQTRDGIESITGHIQNDAPWVMDGADSTEVIRLIEQSLPTIEEVGCKIGIGVATGADKIFIGNFTDLPVEKSRKIPLITTGDIASGRIAWQGLGVINPYENDGELVELSAYPLLKKYMDRHADKLKGRHCAAKSTQKWYRTIDKIKIDLIKTPKLLIPDIKGGANVVLDAGHYYPHHNLYYVTSSEWDLNALCAVLISSLTRAFMIKYSTKMHGGFFRFQAQYLRRLRLPKWDSVSIELQSQLKYAGAKRDINACDLATFKLYNLSKPSVLKIQSYLKEHAPQS